MDLLEQAKILNKIFKGLEDAYGCYRIDNMRVKAVKKTGMAKTETTKPLTVEQWSEHLTGKIGLGVVPINRRNKCNWACLDIDSYEGFDHKKLLQVIFELGLPILVCKSKSGGAHCFLFLSEEVECKYVREYLTKVSICIGHPGVEIFPKQDKLVSEQDKGNWLNMPYFNTDQRKCIVLDSKGEVKELSLEEFGERVELESLTEDQFYNIFNDYNPDKADATTIDDDRLKGGPPCIIAIAKNGGIQNGSRSDVLIHFGTLIYKKYGPDEFNVHMPEINRLYCAEPLSAQELNSTVLLSLNRDRDYKYRCNHPAIKPYCNPNLCIQCPYGIPSKEFIPKLSNLIMVTSDPPIYFMDTNYGRLTIVGDDLNKPKEIQAACLKQLHVRPPLLKDNAWSEILNELLDPNKMRIQEPPKDTQKIELIHEGIKTFVQANISDDKKAIKEINGVYQSDNGRCYFRLQDVYKHLLKYNIIDKKDTKADLSIIMDNLNIEKRRMRVTINGKKVDMHLRGIEIKDINLDIEVEEFELDEGVVIE